MRRPPDGIRRGRTARRARVPQSPVRSALDCGAQTRARCGDQRFAARHNGKAGQPLLTSMVRRIAFPLVALATCAVLAQPREPVARIVSTLPSTTEILFALGLGDRV